MCRCCSIQIPRNKSKKCKKCRNENGINDLGEGNQIVGNQSLRVE
jgi:hypothetical protein